MAQFSLNTASNLFKIKYGKLADNTYNSASVLLGRCKKEYNFVGKRMDIAVPTSLLAAWALARFLSQITHLFRMQ